MASGFLEAGFRCVGAFDVWDDAVATFNVNLGPHARVESIGPTMRIPSCDVIVGGPPCQGFSSAGLRRADDSRNSLVAVFAGIVAAAKPAAFVFENVEGFLTASDGQFVRDLLDPLIDAGYRIHLRKVNAANYGVPQHRKRVLAIGGLGWDPSFPAPTHSAFGAPGAHRVTQGLPPTPTLANALEGLPKASTARPGEPIGHYFEPLSSVDLERAKLLGEGQRMRDLPSELQHKSFQKRSLRRVMDGTPSENRGGAPSGLRRLERDFPSKAITGGALGEFLHPTEDRPLTIRECARVQTFPDTFKFCGTATSQVQLIGNAVPPMLAAQIARNLLRDLREKSASRLEGRLLSFVPTFADAMSPALRKVTEFVEARYLGRALCEQFDLWR